MIVIEQIAELSGCPGLRQALGDLLAELHDGVGTSVGVGKPFLQNATQTLLDEGGDSRSRPRGLLLRRAGKRIVEVQCGTHTDHHL